MLEAPLLSMYVCMTQAAERVCMYVSGILSMYVCMSQTYIHGNLTNRLERVCMLGVKHVCMSQNLVFCRPFGD